MCSSVCPISMTTVNNLTLHAIHAQQTPCTYTHMYMYTHISIRGAAGLEEVDKQLHERVGNGELVKEWTALGGLDGLRHIGEGPHLLQQNRLGRIGGV